MYKELKQAIIMWLLEHGTTWNRVTACKDEFREYIYNSKGEYLIGGKIVGDFISAADELLYGGRQAVS